MHKVKVPLYKLGWYRPPTHGRDPITAQHGCFWLLGFPSGPVHTSLDNLVTQGYPRVPILMPSLMRTPTQHGKFCNRTPNCKLFLNQASQKQDYRATPPAPARSEESNRQVIIQTQLNHFIKTKYHKTYAISYTAYICCCFS